MKLAGFRMGRIANPSDLTLRCKALPAKSNTDRQEGQQVIQLLELDQPV